MSLVSDSIAIAFETTLLVHGEDVVLERDILLTSEARFIPDASWSPLATAGEESTATLQATSTPDDEESWSDVETVENLADVRQVVVGDRWFRVDGADENDSITWEMQQEFTAVRGSTNWSSDAPFPGSRIGERSTDWLILRAEYQDGYLELEPERGDRITVAATQETFRVMPFKSDSPLWQWHDRSGQSVRRVFTKQRNEA